MRPILAAGVLGLLGSGLVQAQAATPIDREALVTRHNPTLARVDAASPFMVGNGNLAFTADITGLQTFQEQYSPRVPLMTQAQWAWHSFPNPQHFTYADSLAPVDVRGRREYFPWFADWSAATKPAIAWLRENPHRFSLGRLSLSLRTAQGTAAAFADLSNTRQTLDLWSGTLRSSFVFDGREVKVETRVHPELDMVMVKLDSPLLASGQLAIDLKFPGVGAQLNPDPADWNHPERHRTIERARDARGIALERQIDDTRYYVKAVADRDVSVTAAGSHTFRIAPQGQGSSLTLQVLFAPQPLKASLPEAGAARDAVTARWRKFWTDGAAVDFSGSTDPRAHELERRIVQSQYLTALNAAGTVPPQEEGLFSNSWNGKFHLEMHPWHAAHFAVWGRTDLLERSMPWYLQHLSEAKQRAQAHGRRGAWWPKMVGPEGRESPSTINPFIMWQQPHPIYLAELIYRSRPTRQTLLQYRDLVFATADLLASYPHFDAVRGEYVIGPPIVPAQEVFPPLTTHNPTFELEYYRFGLATAQRWRERLGLARDGDWDRVLSKLSPLPQKDGLYLATESFPQLWKQARSAECMPPQTNAQCFNRDHPSMLAALGLLPGDGVDRDTMRRTLDAVLKYWDLRQTWGWDFPMMAMTATRLHEPEKAVDLLLRDLPNNQFGTAGMTPRMHLVVPSSSQVQPSGEQDYRPDAETYFPSNGSLLL
ncbi:MAG TPA: hypothetical protein VKB34_22780, partial [Povalibacter sp.]|nr:hypothetical protein [Povalibacter sp.]